MSCYSTGRLCQRLGTTKTVLMSSISIISLMPRSCANLLTKEFGNCIFLVLCQALYTAVGLSRMRHVICKCQDQCYVTDYLYVNSILMPNLYGVRIPASTPYVPTQSVHAAIQELIKYSVPCFTRSHTLNLVALPTKGYTPRHTPRTLAYVVCVHTKVHLSSSL